MNLSLFRTLRSNVFVSLRTMTGSFSTFVVSEESLMASGLAALRNRTSAISASEKSSVVLSNLIFGDLDDGFAGDFSSTDVGRRSWLGTTSIGSLVGSIAFFVERVSDISE